MIHVTIDIITDADSRLTHIDAGLGPSLVPHIIYSQFEIQNEVVIHRPGIFQVIKIGWRLLVKSGFRWSGCTSSAVRLVFVIIIEPASQSVFIIHLVGQFKGSMG